MSKEINFKKDILENNLVALKLQDYGFDISISESYWYDGLFNILATK